MDFYKQIVEARSLHKNKRRDTFAAWYNDFTSKCEKYITEEKIIELFSNNFNYESIFIPFIDFPGHLSIIDHEICNDIVSKRIRSLCGESCELSKELCELCSDSHKKDPIITEVGLDKIELDLIKMTRLMFNITFIPNAQNHGVIGMSIMENRKKLEDIKNEKINQTMKLSVDLCTQAIIKQKPIEFFSNYDDNNLMVHVDIPIVSVGNNILSQFYKLLELNVYNQICETFNCKEFIEINITRNWENSPAPDSSTMKITIFVKFVEGGGARLPDLI